MALHKHTFIAKRDKSPKMKGSVNEPGIPSESPRMGVHNIGKKRKKKSRQD